MTPREYLFGLELHGIKLGLENIARLLEAAGNPHERLPAAHISGTNGKGSVAAMLDAMGRAAGYTVGRFTSPHLMDVAERFMVAGRPMPPAVLDAQIEFFRNIAGRMAAPPTFFEMNTAIALRWFAECGVDLAIIEVGMGGRLDSTNVIQPLATAITNIDLEHTQYLGDTLEKIAFEKAGILKPATPAVIAETKPGPLEVILARARNVGSPVRLLGRDFDFSVRGSFPHVEFRYESGARALDYVPLGLAARYQASNAAVAVALAGQLQARYPRLDDRALAEGLRGARWPCRLEKVLDAPPVIVDGTHNPAGARVLAQELNRGVTVLAVSADKDVSGILSALAPITRVFVLTQFRGSRALPVDALCAAARPYPHRRAPDLAEAVRAAFDLVVGNEGILITGSLFAAGEARAILIDGYGAPPLEF